jgi:phospholipid/cholesterol/gamma-HCH transport system substrate-binding protein
MEKDANYFLVGLFVSLGLAALVVFLIWLAGVHHIGGYDRYTVYFTDSVGGLSTEATVKYKGVEVGRIVDMRLAPDRSDLIKVDIEVKEDTPVRADTQAKLEMQGITGVAHIELSTPNLDAPPPQTLAEEKFPVLKGTGSQLATFLDDLPKLSRQLSATLSAIGEFSKGSTKTAESINKTADSIKGLTDKLKEDPSQILQGPSHRGVEIPK